MAKQIITETIITDDLTGEPGEDVQTVTFSFAGVDYEIDLSAVARTGLGTVLYQYTRYARVVPKGRKSSAKRAGGKGTSGRRVSADRERSTAIRTWAANHGHTLGNRGRIPSEIVEAYEQAHAA
jgi:hypothetical protein